MLCIDDERPPGETPGRLHDRGYARRTHACNTAHTAQHSTAQHAMHQHIQYAMHSTHSMHTLYAHYTRTTHTTLHYAPPTPHYAHPAHSVLVFAAVVSSVCTAPASLLCCALHCRSRAGSSCVTISCVIISYHIMCVCVVWVCVVVVWVWFINRFGVVESMRWEVHHDLTAMPMRLA
eukprot:COSAG06_NODE_4157_length_4512_cov_11.193746_3_plen_177_part_00